METNAIVISVITAILGTGGITAIITEILTARKYRAEAQRIEQDTANQRRISEQEMQSYIRSQMMEINETYKKESDELRRQNEELTHRINDLTKKTQELMEWIIYDNNRYRSWLETELIKLKPDIQFPTCRPAPGFELNTDSIDNSSISSSDTNQ